MQQDVNRKRENVNTNRNGVCPGALATCPSLGDRPAADALLIPFNAFSGEMP